MERLLSVLLAWALLSGAAVPARAAEATRTFDRGHRVFAMVLDRFVRKGLVNYSALKANPRDLTLYLDSLDELSQPEFESMEPDDRLALLINLYNASTLQLVIDNYPIKSIKDIGVLPHAAWRKEVVRMHHTTLSLQTLEDTLIRAKFPQQPGIHFTLVCAAKGCPLLRQEPYVGARLQDQIDDQARTFFADPSKNRVIAVRRTVVVSKIFNWYGSDFTRNGKPLLASIDRYFPAEAQEELKAGGFRVEFSDYDWSLNDASPAAARK